MWLKLKNSQPCTNASNMTIAEALENSKKQNIDINLLDDLMLATEVKTIQRNGIRFLNGDYFDERLYGLIGKVLLKYNRFRQIVQLISKLEIIAKENGIKEIIKEVMEQII